MENFNFILKLKIYCFIFLFSFFFLSTLQCEAYTTGGMSETKRIIDLLKYTNNENNENFYVHYADMGIYCREEGNYADAEIYYEKALEIMPDKDKKEMPAYVYGLKLELGLSCFFQNKYDKAGKIFLEILDFRKKYSIHHYRSIARIHNILSFLFLNIKEKEEIENLNKEFIDEIEKFEKDNWMIIYSLNNLAVLHLRKHEFKKAEKLYKRAVRISEKVLKQNAIQTKMLKDNFEVLKEIQSGKTIVITYVYDVKNDFILTKERKALSNAANEINRILKLKTVEQSKHGLNKNKFKNEEAYFIEKIKVSGHTILSDKTLKKIISNYEKRKLTVREIKILMLELENFYMKKGCFTTKVYAPVGHNIAESKKLIFFIKEGFIEKIIIKDEDIKEQILSNLLIKERDILNMKKLDNDLTTLRQRLGKNIYFYISPAKIAGGSLVIISKGRLSKEELLVIGNNA